MPKMQRWKPISLTSYRPNFTVKAILCFLLFYLCAIQACRIRFSRDPTSYFFSKLSYFPNYSLQREHEATKYIINASSKEQPKGAPFSKPRLCLGITSMSRNSQSRYLYKAIGSLLEGLDDHERSQIHLMIFVAHVHPLYVHPAAAEWWMRNVADTVHEGYANLGLTEAEFQLMRDTEFVHERVTEKAPLDYLYLLKACHNTGAEYVAMLADDVLALDGWYHRTMAALEAIESHRRLTNAPSFLYLRLFYTEQYLGWRASRWPIYLLTSTAIVLLEVATLLALRTYLLPSTKSNQLSNRHLILYALVFTPSLIALFFAAGRPSLFPLRPGLNKLPPSDGFCAQGLLYPAPRVPHIVEWLEKERVGFVDELIEQYADQSNAVRWTLTPSVLQHPGARSSAWDDHGVMEKAGRSNSEKVYNFGFEMNNSTMLRREHLLALERGQ